MNTVELRPVYEFTCEECGADSIVRVATQTAVEEIEIDGLGVQAVTISFNELPSVVTCKHCGERFSHERADCPCF